MAEKFVSERNLKFLLYDVFDLSSLTSFEPYADHSREVFDMVLDTAMKIGRDMLKPHLADMDRRQPELVDGQVRVHPWSGNSCGPAGKAAGFPPEPRTNWAECSSR